MTPAGIYAFELRCHNLRKRGVARGLRLDLYYAGDESLVALVENATDAQICELNAAHAAREKATT